MSASWGDRPSHRAPARKILPPSPPTPHVHRERLGARAEHEPVADRPVTLVSAPTGYGKSTFLASWAATASTRVAWLTLDDLDNDPQTLWDSFLASIEASLPADGLQPTADGARDHALIPSAGLPHEMRHESTTVDDLITVLDDSTEPLVVVLDNIDEIRSEPSRAILDRLIRYLPDQLRLVLAGRFDPPLALHRLRSAGQLSEIRAADLRFTPRDVHELAALTGVELADDVRDDLLRATGGWPVAVRMALVTARDVPVGPTLGRLLSLTSPVADLLVTDLLDSLDPSLSRFVLRASTSRRIDARLADTLDGSSDGARHLAECLERGLFLEREPDQPGEPTTYRWHDFFQAQCQARLASGDSTTWRSLHRSAALHWHHRDLEVAVDHALRAGRPDLAARCISDSWIELVLRGQHALLLALCLRLPPPHDEDPDLLLLVAVCRHLEGNPVQADLQVRRASARAASRPSAADGGRFALLESLLRVVLAVEPPDLEVMAEHGARLLAPSPRVDDETATAGAEYVVGQLLTRTDQAADGVALLEAASTIATSRGMTALRLACEAEISLVESSTAGVGAGRARARRVLDEAGHLGWGTATALSPAVLALARWAFQRDDLETARSLATRTAARTQPADHYLRACADVTLLEIALAAGDPGGAQSLHTALVEGTPGRFMPPSWPAVVSVLDARWSYAHGSPTDARRTAEKVAHDPSLPRLPASLVWCADLLRLTGDAEGALRTLDLLPLTCATTDALVAHRLVRALLADADEQPDRAHGYLEQALSLAEVDDLRRPFVDRSCQLLPLLRAHLTWGGLHAAFCMTIVDHLPSVRPAAPLVPSFWSLTPREHEVLRLLRSTMTAADIAAATFVSVNTVKTHQRAIYRKLGVAGRREAVQVATDQGLI